MRKSMIFLLLGLVVMSFLLFRVRYQVQELEEDVAHVERTIIEERESIHVLQAEWSYLTRPARLQALAEKHLGMKPATYEQLARWEDIPMLEAEPAVAEVPVPAVEPQEKTVAVVEPAPAPVVVAPAKKAPAAKPPAKIAAAKKAPVPVVRDEAATVWDALRVETSASGGHR